MNQVFLTVVKSGCNGRNEDNLWSLIILCVKIYKSKTIIYSKVVQKSFHKNGIVGSKVFTHHNMFLNFLNKFLVFVTESPLTLHHLARSFLILALVELSLSMVQVHLFLIQSNYWIIIIVLILVISWSLTRVA